MKALVLVFLLGVGIGYIYAIPKPQPTRQYRVVVEKNLVVWLISDGMIVLVGEPGDTNLYAIRNDGKSKILAKNPRFDPNYAADGTVTLEFHWEFAGKPVTTVHSFSSVDYWFK